MRLSESSPSAGGLPHDQATFSSDWPAGRAQPGPGCAAVQPPVGLWAPDAGVLISMTLHKNGYRPPDQDEDLRGGHRGLVARACCLSFNRAVAAFEKSGAPATTALDWLGRSTRSMFGLRRGDAGERWWVASPAPGWRRTSTRRWGWILGGRINDSAAERRVAGIGRRRCRPRDCDTRCLHRSWISSCWPRDAVLLDGA